MAWPGRPPRRAGPGDPGHHHRGAGHPAGGRGGSGQWPGHGHHHPDVHGLPGDGRDPGRHPPRVPPPATRTRRSGPCYSPPWSTDWISEGGRAKLAAAGIAPPAPVRTTGVVSLTLAVRCPRCGSPETEQVPVRLHRVQGAVAVPFVRRALRPPEGAVTVTITRPVRRRPVFHPLSVAAVDRLTDDSVAVTFAVPEELRETFAFRAGQHLTVRRARRTAGRAPVVLDLLHPGRPGPARPTADRGAGDPRRRVLGFACGALRGGDTVEVLPPLGTFTTAFAPDRVRHYGAVVAGSGITPVLVARRDGAGHRAGQHVHPGVRQPHGAR